MLYQVAYMHQRVVDPDSFTAMSHSAEQFVMTRLMVDSKGLRWSLLIALADLQIEAQLRVFDVPCVVPEHL